MKGLFILMVAVAGTAAAQSSGPVNTPLLNKAFYYVGTSPYTTTIQSAVTAGCGNAAHAGQVIIPPGVSPSDSPTTVSGCAGVAIVNESVQPTACYTTASTAYAATPCTASSAPSGSAGGDLSGTYPNPEVVQIEGAAIPASATVVGTNSNHQLIAVTSLPYSFLTGAPAAGVSSVSNSDGSLAISPTAGDVVASINTAHANTYSALQTFGDGIAATSASFASGDAAIDASGDIFSKTELVLGTALDTPSFVANTSELEGYNSSTVQEWSINNSTGGASFADGNIALSANGTNSSVLTPFLSVGTQLNLAGSQNLTGIQGTAGTHLAATYGSFTTGNFRSTDASGDEIDSGVSATAPTFTGTATALNALITGAGGAVSAPSVGDINEAAGSLFFSSYGPNSSTRGAFGFYCNSQGASLSTECLYSDTTGDWTMPGNLTALAGNFSGEIATTGSTGISAQANQAALQENGDGEAYLDSFGPSTGVAGYFVFRCISPDLSVISACLTGDATGDWTMPGSLTVGSAPGIQMPLFNAAGTKLASAHAVAFSGTLSGGTATVTLAGSAAFANGMYCTANTSGESSAGALTVSPQSVSSLVVSGTGTTFTGICIGN